LILQNEKATVLGVKHRCSVLSHSCIEGDDHLAHEGDLAWLSLGLEAFEECLPIGTEADCRKGSDVVVSRTGLHPPAISRLPRIRPLSRLSGATPTSLV
jgi:hypothetical protein